MKEASRSSRVWCAVLLVFSLCTNVKSASAEVFINEVAINPPGSLDDFREFVELQGTPGRKLDGYAIAFLSGTEFKYYTLNSIPPLPNPKPEIDEFFSLDGLSLGANGLLVIGIANQGFYAEVLSDSNFFGPWVDLWNGGLDPANRLQNDGSNTVLLIRKRPGKTQADLNNAGGLRWGKGIAHDFQLIRPAIDPQDGQAKDQWGDGDLDDGRPNGLVGNTLDMTGQSTATITDDLEIVDEISYESERGWEYDIDDRHVDLGSDDDAFPERHVHALDDPQGFNPDSLTRVDYRTTGIGWPTADGAVGEMPSGRNWQDTATEQWIRGENNDQVVNGKEGPELYYLNAANSNSNAIQPFMTHVPLWLNDQLGTEYNFAGTNTYRIMAGRVNPLAIPFIPGDADRDGDCDQADIVMIATVFGDDDWIFSNAFGGAPMGDEGDPALQIRPWDVDATGNNGIEPSDLQWTLNFQGNTNGRILGVRYDSPTPSATGLLLASNSGVNCSLTTAMEFPCGGSSGALKVGDFFDVVVSGQVTSGARTTPSQANGIMQFTHDISISTGGILRAIDAIGLGDFAITRSAIHSLTGASGDRGISKVSGHTTSFIQGVSGARPLYRIRFEVTGTGSAQIGIARSAYPKFMVSTPRGLKVGHTDHNGDPAAVSYPAGILISISPNAPMASCDVDPQVSASDHECFVDCMEGPDEISEPTGSPMDLDEDGDIDLEDFSVFERLFGH